MPAILDVGASSGISSAEWSAALDESGVDHTLHVADLVMWGSWTAWNGLTFLYEPGVSPYLLQADIAEFAFPSSSGSLWRACVFRIIKAVMPHRLLARLAKPVMLVGPAIRRRAESNSHISFHQFDVFESPPRLEGAPFQVIRAANLLNKVYFSDDKLLVGLKNLLSLLDFGGVLVLARTLDDGSNHASIYVRSQNGLDRVAVVGTGYKSDHLVTQLNASK